MMPPFCWRPHFFNHQMADCEAVLFDAEGIKLVWLGLGWVITSPSRTLQTQPEPTTEDTRGGFKAGAGFLWQKAELKRLAVCFIGLFHTKHCLGQRIRGGGKKTRTWWQRYLLQVCFKIIHNLVNTKGIFTNNIPIKSVRHRLVIRIMGVLALKPQGIKKKHETWRKNKETKEIQILSNFELLPVYAWGIGRGASWDVDWVSDWHVDVSPAANKIYDVPFSSFSMNELLIFKA